MALSIFSASVSGINAQSNAMSTVSENIANMRTVGYKSSDTLFQTMLGTQPATKNNASGLASSRTDIQGVSSYVRHNILQQGTVTSTGNNFDVAINGENAFFVLNNGYGDIYYSRAGEFGTRAENGQLYMVNASGYKLQGFMANGNGTFAGNLSDITITYPERMPSVPTSEAEITANVPADGVETSTYGITIYGPNNDGRTMNMIFSKAEGKLNTWNVSFALDGGTAATAQPIEVKFDDKGTILTPKNININIAWEDGSTNNVALDISNMTQYAGSAGETHISQDGAPSGDFRGSYIDRDGIVKAEYGNGKVLDIAKIALMGFTAPENLTPINGTMFEYNSDVGESQYVMGPTTNNTNILVPQSVEASNVNVEEEFSEMIMVQRAYSLNSSAFTAANEMTSVVIDLKE